MREITSSPTARLVLYALTTSTQDPEGVDSGSSPSTYGDLLTATGASAGTLLEVLPSLMATGVVRKSKYGRISHFFIHPYLRQYEGIQLTEKINLEITQPARMKAARERWDEERTAKRALDAYGPVIW